MQKQSQPQTTNNPKERDASVQIRAGRHTPGPWKVDANCGDAGGLVVLAANNDRIARVCWYGKQSETPGAEKDNARLIAAAPELLEAAEQLIEALRAGPPRVIGYDRDGANQKAFNHGWNSNADRLYELARNARAAIAKARGQ
ncbi:hypothetical protein [Propionivibrio sp.]|uniref:hypothetical protein n=1 Tax=Propionivibrio sp. TaxID=2212460 RepID=UPI0039E5EC17